jgi:hypothetical protein
VKHRTIDYDVQEVELGLWRWNIYPGNRKVSKDRPNSAPANERLKPVCLKSIMGSSGRKSRGATLGTIPAGSFPAMVSTRFVAREVTYQLRRGVVWTPGLGRIHRRRGSPHHLGTVFFSRPR